MYIGLHVKYPLFLSDFNDTWTFSTDFSKDTQTSNLVKIRPVRAELFQRTDGQTEGQTDMAKLRVVFRNFANAPKTQVSVQKILILYFKYLTYMFRSK
jgi:hypothetical protein